MLFAIFSGNDLVHFRGIHLLQSWLIILWVQNCVYMPGKVIWYCALSVNCYLCPNVYDPNIYAMEIPNFYAYRWKAIPLNVLWLHTPVKYICNKTCGIKCEPDDIHKKIKICMKWNPPLNGTLEILHGIKGGWSNVTYSFKYILSRKSVARAKQTNEKQF